MDRALPPSYTPRNEKAPRWAGLFATTNGSQPIRSAQRPRGAMPLMVVDIEKTGRGQFTATILA